MTDAWLSFRGLVRPRLFPSWSVFLLLSWFRLLLPLLSMSALGLSFLWCQMGIVPPVLPSSRGILGAWGLAVHLCGSTHCRVSLLVGELISYILQKVDQNIIFYEKCNEILQKTLLAKNKVVLEGMICGYKGRGKDSCQVSSWTPFYLCIEGEKLPHSQVAGPGLFTISSLHPLVKEMPSKGSSLTAC